MTIVLQRLASIVALDLALCSACGAPSSDADEGSQVDAVVTTATSNSEANCRAPGAAPAPGEPLWLQSYDAIKISGVASDSRGNVLLARSGVETIALGCDGKQLWSVPFGARVAVDDSDNVYIAGGSAETNPFVVKLDANGNSLYQARVGADAFGEVESLAVDRAQNVAVSGPSFGTAQLDAAGVPVWRQPFSGQLAFDAQGRLWLTGALEGTRDLGGTPLTSHGGSDVLLVAFGADGTVLSARSFGDAGTLQRAEAIAVDSSDNVLIAGTFNGSVDFGTGALAHRPQTCSSDAWCESTGFLAKLDAQGVALWSISLGLTRAVPGLASDQHGDIAISSVLPGGVRPFRNTRVALLSPDAQSLWQRSEWPDTGIGAGHAVAFDGNQDVIWSLEARPSLELEEQAYLTKLGH